MQCEARIFFVPSPPLHLAFLLQQLAYAAYTGVVVDFLKWDMDPRVHFLGA